MILRLFKYLLYLVSFLLIAIYALYLLLNSFFINEIKNTLIQSLNNELQTEVAVGGAVNLNLWTYFPHLSIELNNLQALESIPFSTDTLLQAKKVYLLLNLQKLWKQDWEIEHLIIENGKLALLKNKKGEINYQFLKAKEQKEAPEKKQIELKIKSAELLDIALSYRDEKSDIFLDCAIHQLELSGDFSADSITLNLNSAFFARQIEIKENNYISEQEIELNGQFTLFPKEERYSFENMRLHIGNNPFLLNGEIDQRKYSTFYNLKISGQELQANDFLAILPQRFAAWSPLIEITGKFLFETTIRGYLNAESNPYIEINYSLSDAEFLAIEQNIKLEALKLKGSFNNGKKHTMEDAALSLDYIHFRSDGQLMDAQFFYKNFNFPYLILKLNGALQAQHLALIDSGLVVSDFEGLVYFKNFDLRGRFIHTNPDKEILLKGNLNSKSLKFKLEGKALVLEDFDIDFKEDKIHIPKLSAEISGEKINIKGTVSPLHTFLSSNPEIRINANLQTEKLDLLAIEKWWNSGNAKAEETSNSSEINLLGKIDFSTKKLLYKNKHLENLQAEIEFLGDSKQKFQTAFDAMKGKAKILGSAGSECPTCLSLQYQVDTMDIKQVFQQFDAFGQDEIKVENLEGRLSGKGILNFTDYKNLENLETLEAKIYMKITEGALLDFQPMQSLSKFIKIQDLQNIRFHTLENELHIKDGVIDIPEMLILSNAFSLAVSGKHRFSNEIDYLIKLNIYNVLGNKFRLRKNEVPDAEMIDTDNFNFYLRMKGTIDKPIVSFDKQGVRDRFKQQKVEWKQIRQGDKKYSPREEKLQWDTDTELETIDW